MRQERVRYRSGSSRGIPPILDTTDTTDTTFPIKILKCSPRGWWTDTAQSSPQEPTPRPGAKVIPPSILNIMPWKHPVRQGPLSWIPWYFFPLLSEGCKCHPGRPFQFSQMQSRNPGSHSPGPSFQGTPIQERKNSHIGVDNTNTHTHIPPKSQDAWTTKRLKVTSETDQPIAKEGFH